MELFTKRMFSLAGRTMRSAFVFLKKYFRRRIDIAKQDNRKPLMNGQIRSREVRLIGAEGEQLGVTPTAVALTQAEDLNMDLVLISNQEPPVAKIMDYTKFMFEQKKKQKEVAFIFYPCYSERYRCGRAKSQNGWSSNVLTIGTNQKELSSYY